MLKHKKETVIAASFFAIALVAVVIKNNTLESELVSEETAVAPAFQWEEPLYDPEDTLPPVEEEVASTHASDNPSVPLMPGRMSFGQAFSQARIEYGLDQYLPGTVKHIPQAMRKNWQQKKRNPHWLIL